MMWVKRSLWVVAWALWAWLGVRLYVELPRDAGTPLCQVGEDDEECLGFVPGAEVVVTRRVKDGTTTHRFWDARTGNARPADEWALRDIERRPGKTPVLTPRGEPPIKSITPISWDEKIERVPYVSPRRELLDCGGVEVVVTPFPNQHAGADKDAVTELWALRFGQQLWSPVTCAVRRLKDEQLCWRTWEAIPELFADSGELWLDREFNVFADPGPNWMLLALCQAVLALPLVLTWAGVRWWSRRLPRQNRGWRGATVAAE